VSVKIKIPKKILYKLYIKKGLSSARIAEIYKCERTAILNRLREYEIPVKHPKKSLKPNKQILYNLYIDRQLSPYKIAKYFNCSPSTVRNWLFIYNFPVRKKNLILASKKQLSHLYFKKRCTLKKIADLLGYTPSGIFGVFKKHGIALRTYSQSSKYYFYRSDFDGDNSFKAYLTGFRIGDLHVIKEGHLIRIGSGTTKRDQLTLINGLFKKYGKVYLGAKDKRGAWHPEVSLNDSFYFLIPKYRTIPSWIKKSKKYFLSFVAGYTDAEGNIGCYPRARFKITSYDYGIIKGIGTGLKKYYNINPIYFLERTDRKTHNKDALSLIINNMHSVFTFLNHLTPQLQHKKRKDNAIATLESIKHRKHFNA